MPAATNDPRPTVTWEDRRVRADRDVILEDRPLEFDVSAERIRIVRQDGLRSEKDVIADRTFRGNVRARLETRVRADGRGPVNSHVRSDDDVITDFGSPREPEVTGRKSVTDDHVVVNNRPGLIVGSSPITGPDSPRHLYPTWRPRYSHHIQVPGLMLSVGHGRCISKGRDRFDGKEM